MYNCKYIDVCVSVCVCVCVCVCEEGINLYMLICHMHEHKC